MSMEDYQNAIESLASGSKGGKTNYFQKPYQDLTAPGELKVQLNEGRKAQVFWHTAYAGDAAIDRYEIWRDGAKIATLPFTPQTSKTPYTFTDHFGKIVPKQYVVKVVDKKNRVADSNPVVV